MDWLKSPPASAPKFRNIKGEAVAARMKGDFPGYATDAGGHGRRLVLQQPGRHQRAGRNRLGLGHRHARFPIRQESGVWAALFLLFRFQLVSYRDCCCTGAGSPAARRSHTHTARRSRGCTSSKRPSTTPTCGSLRHRVSASAGPARCSPAASPLCSSGTARGGTEHSTTIKQSSNNHMTISARLATRRCDFVTDCDSWNVNDRLCSWFVSRTPL